MAITDARIVRALPAGAKNIKKSDGTIPSIRYVPVGANLLPNGGFEVDASGWTAQNGATISRDTGTKKNGTASLKAVIGSVALVAQLSSRVTVHPGVTYLIEYWGKLGAGADTQAVELLWYDASGTLISNHNTTPGTMASGSSFAYAAGAHTAPANAATADVHLRAGADTGDIVFFDDVCLRVCVPLVESPFAEPTSTGSSTSGSLKADPIAADVYYAGDVKVFDMGAQTDPKLAESSYTRVHGTRHKYAGDVLVDTGIYRVQFNLGDAHTSALLFAAYVDGAWHTSTGVVNLDTGGDDTATISTVRVLQVSRHTVAVEVTDSKGNKAKLTFQRGSHAFRVDVTRLVAQLTHWDFSLGDDQRWQVYNAITVLKDAFVTASQQSVAAASLTEPYALVTEPPSVPFLSVLVFPKKPTTLFGNTSSDDWLQWRLSSAPLNESRTFWIAIIPWPWLTRSDTFVMECEGGTDRAGTPTNVADALASGGNATQLDALNEERIGPALVVGRDIPLGEYTLVLRAKDLNQVTDDLAVAVWNATDAAHQFVAAKTCAAAYGYLTTDVALTSAEDGDTIHLSARKRLSTANTITVDYWLLIPKKRNSNTPSHVFFPRDVARNALMQVTMRESVRKK